MDPQQLFTVDLNQGLDHVALCVRSLSVAKTTFENLGFNVYPDGKHEDYGTQNRGAWFANDTYVELLACFDPVKASWLADFLEKHEGAFFLVLRVTSAHKMASLLRNRGLEINDPIPGTWQQEGDQNHSVLWHSLFLPKINLPGKLLFFIEYTNNAQLSKTNLNHPIHFASHPNSSKKLQSVWIAVDNLEKAAKEFEDIGFQVGPTENFVKMHASKRVINVGRGKIELIHSLDPNSSVFEFLKQRGEGIFGFSIEIEDFSKAKAQLSEEILKAIDCNNKERCLLFPPHISHGAWIELRQNRPSV